MSFFFFEKKKALKDGTCTHRRNMQKTEAMTIFVAHLCPTKRPVLVFASFY